MINAISLASSPSQVVGYIAMVVTLYSRSKTDDHQLMAWSFFAASLWALHFFMLSAVAPAMSSFFAAFRYGVMWRWSNTPKTVKVVLSISISLAMVGLALYDGSSLVSWLTAVAATLISFSVLLARGMLLRILLMLGDVLWLCIDIMVFSIGGTIFDITSLMLTLKTTLTIRNQSIPNTAL